MCAWKVNPQSNVTPRSLMVDTRFISTPAKLSDKTATSAQSVNAWTQQQIRQTDLHQKAWCQLGSLGLSKRHPPLVEHVAYVGHWYFRVKGEETGRLVYWARMHRFFAELEPSVTVTEQNLADRVRYILRSNIFGLFPQRMKMLRLGMRHH
ncbi:unnamed protein product [Parnassius apollo]|uniref:(apollo) hypothetical protein n=1 Tax=Parnassius apollo TaxID=110799 RepID=A0A8S3W8M4_PARAO|nr:unnamed protein product [Parnassius apollo]